MRAKYLLYAMMLLLLPALSSCALMPEEETVRTAPVVQKFEGDNYESVMVERGELTLIQKVNSRYQPVKTQNLSFDLGGELVDRMFVRAGDSVEEGQLLGQLQLGDLEERMDAVLQSIEELELRIDYLDDEYALKLRRAEIEYEALESTERAEAFEELEEEYVTERRSLSDQLAVLHVQLDNYRRDLDEHQVRAPFAGTVTYVKNFKDGDLSDYGQTVIKLADSTMSLFRAETEYWDRFHPGDEHMITVSKQQYPVTVQDEVSLGLPETEKTVGKKGMVYFVLQESGAMFEDGDIGVVDLVLEHRDDALYVNRDAIVKAGDMNIVYYKREDGLSSYKEVEVGFTADKKTEILSGLVEGESVIKR